MIYMVKMDGKLEGSNVNLSHKKASVIIEQHLSGIYVMLTISSYLLTAKMIACGRHMLAGR